MLSKHFSKIMIHYTLTLFCEVFYNIDCDLFAASHLTVLIQQQSSTTLSRNVSSVGEPESRSYTPPLPKRAETFSGFEGKDKAAG